MATGMPKEMASAANLMVHPLAGAAALSALGVGLASQTLGVWMGAWAGAAEVSQRLFLPDGAGDVGSFGEAEKQAQPVAAKVLRAPVDEAAAPVAKAKPVSPVAAKAPPAQAPAAPSPEGLRRPKAAERPETPDDLKAISGIGPKVEQALNGFGVWTYAQVAGWTPEEIAWVEDALGFKGRVGRDGWQAQALAARGGTAE